MTGASSWSFGERDATRIAGILTEFLRDSNSRTAFIIDRTGQLIVSTGEPPQFDATAFASLAAADFSANDQLARLLGEAEFGALVHQGERESMYLADIAHRVILVVLFDHRTTLGLVKLRARTAVRDLTSAFEELFARGGRGAPMGAELIVDAEDEIDKLFGP